MILYLDTSAILKRYFQESFSGEVESKWNQAEAVVSSAVAYAEAMATMYRKKKEAGLDDKTMQKTGNAFKTDWNSFIRVEVSNELNPYIDKLFQKHILRGFDAIHLASAIMIHERFPKEFFFACFDQRLNQAARLEGLESF